MKYAREMKVGALFVICAFLVYFGLHFLKGQNVFSKETHYVGMFTDIGGLTEQAPVFVRGYKVGQVDKIMYDYTQPAAFTVLVAVHRDILVTDPCQMRLVDNGLLGGKAIEVVVPVGPVEGKRIYAEGDTLPATIVPGLMEGLQQGVLAKVDDAVANIDALIVKVNSQIGDATLANTLTYVENAAQNLSASAHDIKKVTAKQLPAIIANADTLIADAKTIVRGVEQADLPATLASVDQTVDSLQSILTTKEGTLGLLLNDKNLYNHIDSTVVSVDSLIVDLKRDPKRYVHFSLFGGKDKAKKKDAK